MADYSTLVREVGGAIGLISLASHIFAVADFSPPILMLVGLGVGVDYALLIFYRCRHELTNGVQPAPAARKALDSAGRTVFFAGCTVIIALLGLVALGLGSLQGVALAVAVTVLVTMAASLVLLPVFHSIWIPVKAAVLNLLSISAALGVVTLVFQHGKARSHSRQLGTRNS
jgi:RND superfamily putative drug exporter